MPGGSVGEAALKEMDQRSQTTTVTPLFLRQLGYNVAMPEDRRSSIEGGSCHRSIKWGMMRQVGEVALARDFC